MGRFSLRRDPRRGSAGRASGSGRTPGSRQLAAIGAIVAVGMVAHAGLPGHTRLGLTRSHAARPGGAKQVAGGQAVPMGTSARHAIGRRGGPLQVAPPVGAAAPSGQAPSVPGGTATRAQETSYHQIVLPDLLVVAPNGLTASQLRKLRRLAGVRNMITFDGAQITAGGRSVSVIGVSPQAFRSWVPLDTALDQRFWTALGSGEFVAAQSAQRRLRLQQGKSYQLVGASAEVATFGASARLGLSGVDLLVNQATSRKLGLIHHVAALISAPGAGLGSLTAGVRKVLGPGGKIETLRSQRLPVAAVKPGTRPTSYLQLFKASAAEYCPGLSWTVLAAIGQIESADGTNDGPSTAGALGPMQFLPSTWKIWGIDGFGETGPPNVMDPYDAVPSAARLLCADGAASGGQSLYNAIFDYNHANWYVREVLALAAQYAADYR
jgi:Transglycosylase SLT domain